MLSNQVIQKVIQDMKAISGLDCSIWNAKAECLAMTSIMPKGVGKKIASFMERAVRQDIS